MRLGKIKLAGFKTFVDPTTIALLGARTAVVGPNGCGKSNVIDAVRWVMGESSAKNLRGGALTDVIFSGSSARKPVGQATVELLFDNALGKLGGEYASYSEISIKRQVTRDGQSTYYLNGQRCRRKDITDIFLGTGMGPRSYAIIEQGMISRVVESKPEDLRIFIEEAAGISKYKERRRETENRIRHTHDNLARVNDLRDELGKQLNHLERQSQAAERYNLLKHRQDEMSAQLAAMVYQRLDTEYQGLEVKIRNALTDLESHQATAQQLKTQQEKQRVIQVDASERLSEVQKRYYSVGAEIAKTEQSISFHQERQQQLRADKAECEQTLTNCQEQLQEDKEALAVLEVEHCQALPIQQQSQQELAFAQERQQLAESALEGWRDNIAQLQQAQLAPSRIAEAEKAKITHLESQIHQNQERQKRIEAELAQQQVVEDQQSLAVYDEKIDALSDSIAELDDGIQTSQTQKQQAQTILNELKPQLKKVEQALNELHLKHSAFSALQAAALGKNDSLKQAWLSNQSFHQNFLIESIKVQSPWQLAVETVLEGYLEAIGVGEGQLRSLQDLDALKGTGVHLIECSKNHSYEHGQDSRLVHQITGIESLAPQLVQRLSQVHICLDIHQAETLLSQLSEAESVITQEGVWLGQGWIKAKANHHDNTISVLERQEQIRLLEHEIAELEQEQLKLQDSIEQNEEKLSDCERIKEDQNHQRQKQQQELISLQGEKRIRQNKVEQAQLRFRQMQRDIQENREQNQRAQQEINSARSALHQALETMATLNDQYQSLCEQKEPLQQAVLQARSQCTETTDKVQKMAMSLQSYQMQMETLANNVSRWQAQIETAKVRLANVTQNIEINLAPMDDYKITLEEHLENQIRLEDELSQARDEVAQHENQYRALEQQLNQVEQALAASRESLEKAKMDWQAIQVRRENALEKINTTEFTLESLLSTLPNEANEQAWQQELQSIEQKIQRLGAINLAAIDEFAAAKERKDYLDSQLEDLMEALTTLENAIKKIDKETRAKFKETFDKINGGFSRLFPVLFGGGQAALTLTGEDLLDTGVSMMAQPPGKKNSSIHLLSGGEKALTAIALVFSIFELNPAPFCMLDEVDAPLDDSNVGRFCHLVKEMSKTVQFIYVSHNKVAIEMAEQLQGVTMREPGVSRLVTVDIEEAKSMAEA